MAGCSSISAQDDRLEVKQPIDKDAIRLVGALCRPAPEYSEPTFSFSMCKVMIVLGCRHSQIALVSLGRHWQPDLHRDRGAAGNPCSQGGGVSADSRETTDCIA